MADQANQQARKIDYPPVQAEALYLLGLLEQNNGRYQEAIKINDQAALLATACGHEEILASIWGNQACLLMLIANRPADGENRLKAAHQLIERSALGEETLQRLLNMKKLTL